MKIITAPEYSQADSWRDVSVFLGGGITGCEDWQSAVIKELADLTSLYPKEKYDSLVIYNPRRPAFDTKNANDAEQQIRWEYHYLERMDIFSMMFCGNAIQPICLYELGRNIVRMQQRFDDYWNRIIIACSPDYERAFDVKMQTSLAMPTCSNIAMDSNPRLHAERILIAYSDIKNKK